MPVLVSDDDRVLVRHVAPLVGRLQRGFLSRIELRLNDDLALEVHDAVVADCTGENQALHAVGAVLVLVPVEKPLHAHRLGKPVECAKALLVTRGSLVRHENVGLLPLKVAVDGREDRRAVPARHAAPPDVALAHATHEGRGTVVVRIAVRHPDLTTKDAAQTADAHARHAGDAPVQVVARKLASPQPVVELVRIRVVITRNPPDVRIGERLLQHHVQRRRRLKVAENDHGIGRIKAGGLIDLIKRAVRIAAEKDLGQVPDTRAAMAPAAMSPRPDLLFRHD